MTETVILIIVNCIVFSVLCSQLAFRKGYKGGGYALFGFFFSIVALMYVAGLPVARDAVKNRDDLQNEKNKVEP
jgi:hypothetical protein